MLSFPSLVRSLAMLLVLAGCPEEAQGPTDSGSGVDAGDTSCRTTGCSTGSWCDAASGQCLAGCDEAVDCASTETCNTGTHQCECAAGYHLCGQSCVSDADVATCGASCTPCPTDPLGTATCAVATCGITCNANTLSCGGACAACPANATTTQCNGAQCIAATCGAGRLLCAGQCPACPAGASTTQCAGAACEATACASGRLLCSGQCPACPAQATATACNGGACVASACGTGFALCGGACVACSAGQNFCCKEPVTGPQGSGPDHALALDASDQPVIAFRDTQAGSVKLARRGAAGFSVQTLDTGDVGAGVSVAVDASGVAHVAYMKNDFPYALRYARVPLVGAPSVETIPTPSLTVVGDTDIAFDEATSTVHVGAYLNGRGWYASRQGTGAWDVRYAMFDGNQIRIALSGGLPHLIASSNASVGVQASVLSHGVWVPGGLPDGGSFATSTVNSTVGVSVFHEASLTVDDAGTPWVAFQHPNFRDLRLATLDGGTWVKETVDSTFATHTAVAWYGGAPRIAYSGTASFVPRYAEKSGTFWTFSTIDPKTLQQEFRLKVDSTGRPHVTMYDPDPAVRRVVYVH